MKTPHKNAPHVHAELIHAYADGADIQLQNSIGEWMDEKYPTWNLTAVYRIKPAVAEPHKPKPDVVQFWCASCEPLKRPLENNLKLTFDGETGKLKSSEVL